MEEFEGKTVLFYKGKNYIPQDDNIRWSIGPLALSSSQSHDLSHDLAHDLSADSFVDRHTNTSSVTHQIGRAHV